MAEQWIEEGLLEVWTALRETIAGTKHSVTLEDSKLHRIEFSAEMTAMTWGQNMYATVSPHPQRGTLLRIEGNGRFPTLRDRNRIQKISSEIFNGVSGRLTRAVDTSANAPGSPPCATSSAAAGWYGDPVGRADWRYWDGAAWTEHVSRAGKQDTDPVG